MAGMLQAMEMAADMEAHLVVLSPHVGRAVRSRLKRAALAHPLPIHLFVPIFPVQFRNSSKGAGFVLQGNLASFRHLPMIDLLSSSCHA